MLLSMPIRFYVLAILLVFSGPAWAQPGEVNVPSRDPEAGRSFVEVFRSADYEANQQNWAVASDARGVVYTANQDGVLEFDGADWRLIELPNRFRTLSLDVGWGGKGEAERVWVGGTSDFGYLAPDSVGQTAFVSLLEDVPEDAPEFGEVWMTFVTDKGVYFTTAETVFRWNGDEMETWLPKGSDGIYHASFVVDGTFYIREWGVGLLRMEETDAGDELRLVSGGERFAQTRIYSMLPFDDEPVEEGGRILVVTREEELFLWSPSARSGQADAFVPFETEADEIFERGGLYLGAEALPGGRFALNTTSAGVAVIDRAGRLLQHIDQAAGLVSDAVMGVHEDETGTLWLAQLGGVSRVEVGSAMTRFDASNGVPGEVQDFERHEGLLYTAYNQGGVRYLDPAAGVFRPVANVPNQNFDLLSVAGDLLIAGGNDGVFRVVWRPEGPRAEPVRVSENYDYLVAGLHVWHQDSSIVFVVLSEGLGVLRREGGEGSAGRWVDAGRVSGVEEPLLWIAEDVEGALWLTSTDDGITRVRVAAPDAEGTASPGSGAEGAFAAVELTTFGEDDGLLAGPLWAGANEGTLYLGSLDSERFGRDRFRYVPPTEPGEAARFAETYAFDEVRSEHPLAGFRLEEDAQGRVWIASTYEAPVVAHPRAGSDDGGAAADSSRGEGDYTFERLHRFRDDRISWVESEDDGVVWLVGEESLIRFDTRQAAAPTPNRPPLVRRVTAGGDSLVWGGEGEAPATRLAHADGAVTFGYAAPGGTEAARFRTRLAGFDDDGSSDGWSDWTTVTERAYTSLPPGRYRFEVEAEGRGGVAGYDLRVRPPWYRMWWAYGLWSLLAVGLVYGVVHTRTVQLQARQRELEQTVHDRTAELEQRTNEIERQRQAAEQQAAELDTVNRVSRALVSQLEFDGLVRLVGEQMRETFRADIVYVALLDREAGRIDFPYAHGDDLTPIAYGEGLTSQIIRTKEPLLINRDMSAQTEEMGIERIGKQAASYLGVPIPVGDEAIGVISVQSTEEENQFDDDSVRLLSTIAANIGVALDNAASYRRLEETLGELKTTQAQLVHQEKLASLGSLTAGIAHEIKNPLNFVTNFAEVNEELADELREDLAEHPEVLAAVEDLLADLEQNTGLIKQHGQRADSIVKSMMAHARGGEGARASVDLNTFVDEYVDLAYHGQRARVPDFNADIVRDYGSGVGEVELVPQDVGRVLINLLGNAFDAVHGQAGKTNGQYAPKVEVTTRRERGRVEIRVVDNGPGMPEDVKAKIFEPFFTTKPTGSGTGLGLSMSHDIIAQGHGGTLEVESAEGEGAAFVVTLPAAQPATLSS